MNPRQTLSWFRPGRALVLPFLFALGGAPGCGSTPTQSADPQPGRVIQPDSAPDRLRDDQGAVLVDGEFVTRDTLWPYLAEAQGGTILEEVVLDRRLARELERRALRITDEDVEAEQDNLIFVLLGRAATDENDAARILDQTRNARGLGPARYDALLRRNAMLRRLVRDDVTITSDDIQRLYSVRHGPKVVARIIVMPTEREAAGLRDQILAHPDTAREEFARLAMDNSIDATSARGGLIEPFSTEDPAYPLAARSALDQVEPGQLTPVIGLDAGFAFLRLEKILPADDVSLADARPRLERELRLRQERLLMQQRAAALLADARVTVIDRALGWSWAEHNATH